MKNVPLVSLSEGYSAYRTALEQAARKVLESGWYILGEESVAFEKEFARWCGAAEAVGVGNGTDAITIALRALDIGAGDAVFTVSHTAVATVAAIELAGDARAGGYRRSQFHARPRQTGRGGGAVAGARPRAVAHLYGHPCDLASVGDVCRRHDLRLIEDCAQAHGARLDGKLVGGLADLGSFSFYPTKNLGAFGDGGAVTTQDATLAGKLRALRQYGWHERYLSDMVGMNTRLDELQAALLRVRLLHLDDEIAARRAIAKKYDALGDVVGVPVVRAGCAHAYHLYVVRVKNRDAVAAALKARGIGTGIHYPLPVHRQKAYAGRIALAPSGMEVTDRIGAEILSLPMYPFLADEDVARVISAVRAVAQETR